MKTLAELNKKYELYSNLEREYDEEIKEYLQSLVVGANWQRDYEMENVLFFMLKDDFATYRVEYWYGWKVFSLRIFHKKDFSKAEEKDLTPEELSRFYKKINALKNFK